MIELTTREWSGRSGREGVANEGGVKDSINNEGMVTGSSLINYILLCINQ